MPMNFEVCGSTNESTAVAFWPSARKRWLMPLDPPDAESYADIAQQWLVLADDMERSISD